MNRIVKFALYASLLVGLAGMSFGQTALTQTTLASAMGAGPASLASGVSAAYSSTISLASATGVTAAVNGQPVTFAYVDQELIGILGAFPGQTKVFYVLRAQGGSKASQHASGSVVYIENVRPDLGGFSGSGGFQNSDPPKGGACTAANTLVTPWINVTNANQWICDATGRWVQVLSTGSITPAATSAAVQTAGQTFTLNGVISGEPLVIVSQPAPTSLCPPVAARATATNTVTIYFSVLTAAACTPASGVYEFEDPLH